MAWSMPLLTPRLGAKEEEDDDDDEEEEEGAARMPLKDNARVGDGKEGCEMEQAYSERKVQSQGFARPPTI